MEVWRLSSIARVGTSDSCFSIVSTYFCQHDCVKENYNVGVYVMTAIFLPLVDNQSCLQLYLCVEHEDFFTLVKRGEGGVSIFTSLHYLQYGMCCD